MSQSIAALREWMATISDLSEVASVLSWDQQTMMAPMGVAARSDQLATLAGVIHERFASDETGRLLDRAEKETGALDPDSDDACLVRVTRRDYGKARRVPASLRAEMSRASALARPIWAEARRKSDWSMFQPELEKSLALRRRYIECFEPADEDYDILLDDFEPGMKTADVRAIFAELSRGLVPLVAEVLRSGETVRASFLDGPFPLDAQRAAEREILEAYGFTRESWRLDDTVHPFASRSGPDDIRITTRHAPDSIHSLFSCMHEFGHGLYEHQVDRALRRTPLGRGASLAIHESQSRLWENQVGRSRAFWRRFYPGLRARFPEVFRSVEVEEFYRAANRVAPTFIRVDSDEATYNLHIILRFEMEQGMITGAIPARDVPDAWNAKVKEYLGLDVPDAARGALQDIHWSQGSIGYFSTYALGNVVAAQIWERLRADLPDLDASIEAGDFAPLRAWLRDRIHRHGRKFAPRDLVRRVTGSDLDPKPLLAYLRGKLGEIYGLAPAR
ncbi:MAG: carboxypeptidase M32 [Hyphomicrobiales bacterium]